MAEIAVSAIKQVRKPPYALEAERAVLGALLLDTEAWDKVCGHLHAIDFYLEAHVKIFTAIEQLARKNEPFDALTVAEQLKKHDQLTQIGGETLLFELANSTPVASHIMAYANIIREHALLRRLLGAGQSIANRVYEAGESSARDLLDEAETAIFKIADDLPVDISTIIKRPLFVVR